MAGLALEPREIVSDVADRAHRLSPTDPPAVLRRPAGGAPPPPPVREDPDVVAVHQAWAHVHAAGDQAPAAGTGVRGKVRSRVTTAVTEVAGPAQRDDRALIGHLIRAVDVLAHRCDELGGRVAELEALVEEVVNVVGEDLVRVRALLASTPSDRAQVDRSGSEPLGREQRPGTTTGDG